MKKSVAVVGINGSIGKDLLAILPEYKDYFNLPIRAITRDLSKASDDQRQHKGIELYQGGFDDSDALKKALEGVDVLIDLTAPSVSSKPLIDVAAEAGVQLYFPSEFGCSYSNTKYPNTFESKRKDAEYSRDKGLKTVQVQTGLFAEWNLAKPYLCGIVPEENTYTKIENGDVKHSTTYITDLSKSLAELAHMEPKDIPDEVLIESESVTTDYIAELWEKYKKLTLTVIPSTKQAVEQEAYAADNAANKDFFGFAKIIMALISDGKVDHSQGGHNQLVNPGEKNFKWTKVEDYAEDIMTGKIPPPF